MDTNIRPVWPIVSSKMISILNFGSLNIDHVYHVSAFVRPGETISSLRYDRIPGGKGLNQSVALARAGAHVFHAGKVGEDGAFLVDLLEHDGVDTTWVARDGSVTGHACIQVDEQGQNCIVLHGGANQEITPDDVAAVLDAFHPGDWLVLQNEISCLPEIVEAASRRDMVIVLNPSPITPDLLALDLSSVSYLLLNETQVHPLFMYIRSQRVISVRRRPIFEWIMDFQGSSYLSCMICTRKRAAFHFCRRFWI